MHFADHWILSVLILIHSLWQALTSSKHHNLISLSPTDLPVKTLRACNEIRRLRDRWCQPNPVIWPQYQLPRSQSILEHTPTSLSDIHHIGSTNFSSVNTSTHLRCLIPKNAITRYHTNAKRETSSLRHQNLFHRDRRMFIPQQQHLLRALRSAPEYLHSEPVIRWHHTLLHIKTTVYNAVRCYGAN